MSTAAPVARGVQRRTLRVLVGSQVLGGVGVAGGIAVGGLLAAELSGSDALAGLAQTATVLGAALAAVPLSRLMAARGRRPGLATGHVVGAVGALLAVAAAASGSFLLLLVGMALFGASTAANLQARFAATDLPEPEHRGQALSVVVWATTVGAVAGPNLVDPAGRTARALGLTPLAGAFVWSAVAFALAALLLVSLLRPDPLLLARERAGVASGAPPRLSVAAALAVVSRSPAALLGLAAVAAGHTVMIAVMVMTPVHMDHGGAALRVIGLVISVHVAGMYAFSPVVGWLADRFGRVGVIVGGLVLLVLACLLAGTADPHASGRLGAGLFLLGLGWSCTLIAGSTLLTESVPVDARPGVQGATDLVMGICGASGGALAGVVVGTMGYGVLNALATVCVVPVALLAARPLVGRSRA